MTPDAVATSGAGIPLPRGLVAAASRAGSMSGIGSGAIRGSCEVRSGSVAGAGRDKVGAAPPRIDAGAEYGRTARGAVTCGRACARRPGAAGFDGRSGLGVGLVELPPDGFGVGVGVGSGAGVDAPWPRSVHSRKPRWQV